MGRRGWPAKQSDSRLTPKVIRRKELPALDDEFARDLGDYQTVDELKESRPHERSSTKSNMAAQQYSERSADR